MSEQQTAQTRPDGHLCDDLRLDNRAILLRIYVLGQQLLGQRLPLPSLALLLRRPLHDDAQLFRKCFCEGSERIFVHSGWLLDRARHLPPGLLNAARPNQHHLLNLALASGWCALRRRSCDLRLASARTLFKNKSVRPLRMVTLNFPLFRCGSGTDPHLRLNPSLPRATTASLSGSQREVSVRRLSLILTSVVYIESNFEPITQTQTTIL